MNITMNRCQLVGFVCNDVKINAFDGGRVANVKVQTQETWTDKRSGEVKEKNAYHSVSVFGEDLVNFVETHINKGTHVFVEGKLQTRKYKDLKDDVEKYVTEVVVTLSHGQIIPIVSSVASGDENNAVLSKNYNDGEIPF